MPFGETRANPDIPTDKLFTGQRLDGTGLYYYNGRYLNTVGYIRPNDWEVYQPGYLYPESFLLTIVQQVFILSK